MDERDGFSVEIRGRDRDGKQYPVGAPLLFPIVGAIMLWTVLCTGGWWIWAGGDYANLHLAQTCYGENSQARAADLKCAGVKTPILIWRT